jgi:hypothetical protein
MLVGGCLWLGAAGVHAQKPRVVVMDFAGKGGDKARIQVIRALRDEATFETRGAANQVLKSKGVKITSVAGRAAVAKELSLDYVLWGRVAGRGAAARADIRIAGPKGKEIAARKAGPPGQAKGNARIQKAARALLAEARKVALPHQATVAAAPVVAVAATTEPKSPPPAAAEPKPAAGTVEVEAVEIKTQSSKVRYGPILNIMGGAGGRTRTIEIKVEDGAGGTATRTYESGVYLDIVFRLELRPLARSLTKGLRGLAVEADGDFGIGLETETQGSGAKLDTKAWRVLGQLGYFHGIGKHEVGGLIGIGFDRLAIEDNGTLPSIQYLYLRLGPAYRYFFIERALYLRVDGGFRFPFSYGDLADAFGDAKGFGFDAGLMVGGELDVGFSYALRVSFDYFKPQFSAFPGGMLPGLPAAAQGIDGTDLAINFHVMVGWSF